MIGAKLEGVGFLAHCVNHTLKAVYSLAPQPLLHNEEYFRKNFSVVRGSVMVEILKLIVLCYGIELMVFQLGVKIFRKTDGIKEAVFERKSHALRGNSYKTDVEVCIVSDKKPVPRESKENFKRLALLRCTLNHIVGYRGKLSNFLGNRTLGVNEDVHSVDNLTALDFNRAYLYYFAGSIGKSRRFYIENDHFVLKAVIFRAEKASRGIVDEIALNSVKNFEVSARLLKLQHNLGEGLHVSVVGDGNSLMPPTDSRRNKLLWGDYSVHL